jgi:hypothetical protein
MYMTRTVEHKKIETPTARAKLARGNNKHYQSLIAGKAALGYQRKEDAPHGRWLLRCYLGGDKYARIPLGAADDEKGVHADGTTVFNFEQAKAKALELLAQSNETMPKGTLTVRKAYAKYIEYLQSQGKQTLETERRGAALIMPELGEMLLSDLTSDRIRKWFAALATRPALLRSKNNGKTRNTKAPPGNDPESIRKRRSSANRVLTMLKAALNHAYDEKWVSTNEAWGRRVKRFRDVAVARTRYLSIAEANRLLNACEPSFRLSGPSYLAFVDPSGGSADSMTLAIAHRDKNGHGVLDALRERRPPFSPDDVVEEFATLLKSYRISRVTGDRYAGEWVRQPFRARGIDYICAEQTASDFYRDALPLFNSGKIELLDIPRLTAQFVNLERRTSRSGKDLISHPPGAHDDAANSCAAALVLCTAKTPLIIPQVAMARMSLRLPLNIPAFF